MAAHPIRFGILGCASIARKLSIAITLAPNATLYAVGSRSIEKATKFASENGFPPTAKIYGSYDAVLDDPDVDAVYVPLPTSMHVRWVVLAAEKKKHVLLEKPVALNVEEFDKMAEACELNGVQFMDSTMWIHHPRTNVMKEFLSDSDRFGVLKSVHSCFTFAANPDFLENDIRVNPELDSLGALGDIGWYCIRALLWASDFQLPKSVTALPGPVFNKSGVLLSCGSSLLWEDGKVSTFHCSFLSNFTNHLTIVGTKGSLHLNDFSSPFEENKASFFTVTGSVRKPNKQTVKADIPQAAVMVEEFSRLVGMIKGNGLEPEKKWVTLSRKTQVVLDAVKTSIEQGFQAINIVS